MDRETAVKLYNLILNGTPVGVDQEGNIVSTNTELGNSLYVLGKPTYIRKARLPDGKLITRTQPSGGAYKDPHDWDTREAAAWLREWADLMDPPTLKCPTCKAEGFAKSEKMAGCCTFCDGTEGGH